MKEYRGSLINVEGRGDVLVTRIPKKDRLPRKGITILANGIKKKIRNVEYFTHEEFGRGEMVGIVLGSKL
jgi:hypothetical protein